MKEDMFTNISIPTSIFKKIEKRIESTDFKDVSDYVTYVLKEILEETEEEEEEVETFSEEEEEKVKARLKALGYLE